MKPIKINRPKPYLLELKWDNGEEGCITLTALRKGCPCADCNKDELNGIQQSFGQLGTFKEGMYDLVKLEAMGHYAIKAEWADGHDSGFYTWETLIDIFHKNLLSEDEIDELSKKYDK